MLATMNLLQRLIAIVSIFGLTAAYAGDAPPFKPGEKTVEPPVGKLGYHIGSYLKIEGIRQEPQLLAGQTFLVDTINGHKLNEPVSILIKNIELPAGERCVLRGYETGDWIGVPNEVLRATGATPPQAGWQFLLYFVTTSVEQPKTVKVK